MLNLTVGINGLMVFYNVLDLTAINSDIVRNEVASDKITRRDYLMKLIRELRNVWRPDERKSDERKSGRMHQR